MSDAKINCTACGVEILQSTGAANSGLCGPCHRKQFGRQQQQRPIQRILAAINSRDLAEARKLYAEHPCRPRELAHKMRDAAANNDILTMQFLVDLGVGINAEQNSQTSLTEAARTGAANAVQWLLAHGADVNLGNPLWVAVWHGNAAIVRQLAAAGADINAADGKPARTPLSLARARQHADITTFLEGQGAFANDVEATWTVAIDRSDNEEPGRLDLRLDVSAIRQFLKDSIDRFVHRYSQVAATGVQVFFAMKNGFLEFQLWDKPDYQPFYDGDYRFSTILKLPHWQRHYERHEEVPTVTVGHNGNEFRTRPGTEPEDIQAFVGEFIVTLLQVERDAGSFVALPKSDGCLWAVCDDEDWCWPKHREIRKINRL